MLITLFDQNKNENMGLINYILFIINKRSSVKHCDILFIINKRSSVKHCDVQSGNIQEIIFMRITLLIKSTEESFIE